MASNESPKYIVSEEVTVKKPKPKWANMPPVNYFGHNGKFDYQGGKKNKNKNHKKDINNRQTQKYKAKYNFDDISNEEIEDDFKAIKARSEVIEVENELLNILRNATNASSLDEDFKYLEKQSKKTENPFKKNYE